MDYSELQKLQEELEQKEKARKTAKPLAVKTASPQTLLPAKPLAGKTAKPLDRKPASEQSEQVEKYTTRLAPSMVKRIKIFAAQQDMNDYDVVAKALLEYFERNK